MPDTASEIYDTPAPLRYFDCAVAGLSGPVRRILMGWDEQDVQTSHREYVFLSVREIGETEARAATG